MSAIQELWFGNIKPNENKIITDEEKRLVELMARHQEKLSSSLKDRVGTNFKVMKSAFINWCNQKRE